MARHRCKAPVSLVQVGVGVPTVCAAALCFGVLLGLADGRPRPQIPWVWSLSFTRRDSGVNFGDEGPRRRRRAVTSDEFCPLRKSRFFESLELV